MIGFVFNLTYILTYLLTYLFTFRFAYDESVFPGYSWRGYAVFSDIQKEIIQEVYIEKPSAYRMVMFYHNPSDRTIVGKITLTPEDPSDVEQVRAGKKACVQC